MPFCLYPDSGWVHRRRELLRDGGQYGGAGHGELHGRKSELIRLCVDVYDDYDTWVELALEQGGRGVT